MSAANPWPLRGEVYWRNFDPATGHEMASDHPCVIVQNDRGNRYSALTIVVAITSNLRVVSLPIGVPAGVAGMAKDSVIHFGHVYTIDKQRLGKRLRNLPPDVLAQVDRALACSLNLP